MQCPDCTTFHFLWCLRIASFGAVTVCAVYRAWVRFLVRSGGHPLLRMVVRAQKRQSGDAIEAGLPRGLVEPGFEKQRVGDSAELFSGGAFSVDWGQSTVEPEVLSRHRDAACLRLQLDVEGLRCSALTAQRSTFCGVYALRPLVP